LVCGMQSLEGSKQFFRVIHVETHAIVTHEINLFACAGPASCFNRSCGLVPCEFDGIREKVVKYLRNEALVTICSRQFSEPERYVAIPTADGFLLLKCGFRKIGHIDFCEHKLFTPKPGECQQTIDQLTHFLCILPDNIE